MAYTVDFVNVSTEGLESSPYILALAGLRANETRYFKYEYNHTFTVSPASEQPDAVGYFGSQYRTTYPVERSDAGNTPPEHTLYVAVNGAEEAAQILKCLSVTLEENMTRLETSGVLTVG